jgi:ATP-dependent DNA ligase
LDGELYLKSKDVCFERVCSAVKTKSLNASFEDLKLQNQVRYHVFDIIDLDNPARMPFQDRNALLQDLIGSSSNPLRTVPQKKFKSEEELETHLQQWLEKGFEGTVVRTPDGKYDIGKRSAALLKYVRHQDDEFTIYDAVEGEGKWKGMVGSLVCVTKEGKRFSANLSTDESTKSALWRRRNELVGKKATVQYPNLTRRGVPRFPQVKSIRNFMKMRV